MEELLHEKDIEAEKPKKLDMDELLALKMELTMNKKRLTGHEAHLREETTDYEWANEYIEQIEASKRKKSLSALEASPFSPAKNKKLKV